MSRIQPPNELEAIVQFVAIAPDGLNLQALLERFPQIPRRTLQRRLGRLVTDGRLRPKGQGRAQRYRAIPATYIETVRSSASARSIAEAEPDIPVTTEAAKVRSLVRRPLMQRQPVGYLRSLLDGYAPNSQHYLTPEMLARLHEMGRSPVGARPAGTYARQILDRLLIDLSWSSSRLEGNTYTRLDTQNLIEFGRHAEGRDRLETQMVLNHKSAIEMLVEQADEVDFNRFTVQNLHALLAQNLLPDAAAEGRLRRIEVAISGTVYQPMAIPQQIEEYFDRFLAKCGAIVDPFEQALFSLIHIPYLQPFEDVNKRVSRLAANIPLIKHNLAPLSFVDVPESALIDGVLGVYELDRVELLRDVFVWAYERSCRRFTVLRDSLPEPDPFRLRHRESLSEVVAEVVTGQIRFNQVSRIREFSRSLVDAAELEGFVALVLSELHHLHEGNIARYRLRPSVFRAWQAVAKERLLP